VTHNKEVNIINIIDMVIKITKEGLINKEFKVNNKINNLIQINIKDFLKDNYGVMKIVVLLMILLAPNDK